MVDRGNSTGNRETSRTYGSDSVRVAAADSRSVSRVELVRTMIVFNAADVHLGQHVLRPGCSVGPPARTKHGLALSMPPRGGRILMGLTPNQARRVYDAVGRAQDRQSFFEDAATDRLVAHAALGADQTIFEFGCGTGRLAARLLQTLPSGVNYHGVDISPVMITLATDRLTAWRRRADAVLVDGSLPLPASDGSADCVLSTYVLDLLDPDYARAILDDLHRILTPRGISTLPGQPHSGRGVPRTGRRPSLDGTVAHCAATGGRLPPDQPPRLVGRRLATGASVTRPSLGSGQRGRHRHPEPATGIETGPCAGDAPAPIVGLLHR